MDISLNCKTKMPPRVCRLLIWITTVFSFVLVGTADRDCDVTFSSRDNKRDRFASPGWPNPYPNNKRCVYKFVGLTTERVKLRFSKFNLQGMSPDCRHDYIDLYIQLTSPNDALLDAELLGRFCGDDMQEDLPQQVISTNNVIVLIFFSDDSKTYEGFQGHYEFIDAGQQVTPGGCNFLINSKERRQGYIVSPTYPGTYPNNLHCTYEFQGIPGERIKLTFNDFSLFHGDDYCPFDYVRIKDGREKTYAEDIGVFCGRYENVTVFSSREFLFVEFVTRSGRVSFDENSLDDIADYKFDRSGFNISFEFSTNFIRFDLRQTKEATHVTGTECDVRIISTGGSIGTVESPGYLKGDFPKNTTCKFYLDGEMNQGNLEKVNVLFKDFAISGSIQNCKEGFLGVTKEGHRKPSVIDEKFCGHLWPPELTSKDPRMILTFDTHGASTARFMLQYKFISDESTPINDFIDTDYAISGQHIGREGECSFLFESKRERSGTFNSPRHPDNYPPNIECVYIFQPESRNEKLLISFDMFQLSSGDHIAEPIIDPHSRKYVMSKKCLNNTDFLELYELNEADLSQNRYVPVSIYCGTKFPAPIIAHREIKFRFKAMKNSSFQGFKARYEFVPKAELQKGCPQEIVTGGKGGTITSPRFPLKYESRTYCEWKITASKPQNRILIQLETFKIEGEMGRDGGEGCKNAVLRVQNGKEMSEICGTFNENEMSKTSITSTGNTEVIQFLTSNAALGFKGFRLTWTELHVSAGPCYGFKCQKTGYCISPDLKCNQLPNCGPGDKSDEICEPQASSRGPKKEKVQVVHIVIGTSISVFFCVVLLVCGVYHRKKFRPRDRHSPETDNVEVRYVAATSGSNTTDRLLTIDKSESNRSSVQTSERTENNRDHVGHNAEVKKVLNEHENGPGDHNSVRQNHNTLPSQEKPSTSTLPRPVTAPKIQKVSIV
ncbi:cubilin-like isoform X3 [Ruditapes philippinarum]|uniref:cubilin-like isoform X3 n=1 Tax=Ruditapes philippinarum TaxID=129788 RepID=UPI00295B6687|nr:cubilin-like isoform X3 [Ruditapes philippinarum]